MKTIKLASTDDAMGIIYGGQESAILHLSELSADFFDLDNQLAGEVFQKFVNYRFPVAFIVPMDHALDQRVIELMRDHKSHAFIRFFESEEIAKHWLHSSL